jgi:hypothetical protein
MCSWQVPTPKGVPNAKLTSCGWFLDAKGEGGDFPKSGPWWVKWVQRCPWLFLAPKVLQLCTNHLVRVLCKPVWVSEACQLFLVPSRSSNPPLYPSKGCELGNAPDSFFFRCILGPTFGSFGELGVRQVGGASVFVFSTVLLLLFFSYSLVSIALKKKKKEICCVFCCCCFVSSWGSVCVLLLSCLFEDHSHLKTMMILLVDVLVWVESFLFLLVCVRFFFRFRKGEFVLCMCVSVSVSCLWYAKRKEDEEEDSSLGRFLLFFCFLFSML